MLIETVNVLLIEDNPEHTELVAQLLAKSDTTQFLLYTADTLAQGLARLGDGGIALIILDLQLPDSDGLETFIRTIEVNPDIPLVVLSGQQDVSVAIETVQLGAQDYLVKGHFDNQVLIRALQYAIERKRVQLQLERVNEDLEKRVSERTAALQDTNSKLRQEVAERVRIEETVLETNRQLADALKRLEASQDQVIQRERMHALGRMAHGIAHDFNNALAPILGFSELLLMKPELLADTKKVRSYLEMIHTAAK